MPQLFDCSCRLRVDVQDPSELHQLVASFARLADEREDVLGALFEEGQGAEIVDLTLSAQDVATARSMAKGILSEIEQHLTVRFGPQAVVAEEVVIRAADRPSLGRLGTVPDDGFSESIHAELRRLRRHPVEGPETAMREFQTSRPEGFPSTDQILARIEEWRVFSEFDVVDVGSANITLYFHRLPQQLMRFAEEVLLFCPEVTDEVDFLDDCDDAHPALIARLAVEGIAENLRETRTLRLWWD